MSDSRKKTEELLKQRSEKMRAEKEARNAPPTQPLDAERKGQQEENVRIKTDNSEKTKKNTQARSNREGFGGSNLWTPGGSTTTNTKKSKFAPLSTLTEEEEPPTPKKGS